MGLLQTYYENRVSPPRRGLAGLPQASQPGVLRTSAGGPESGNRLLSRGRGSERRGNNRPYYIPRDQEPPLIFPAAGTIRRKSL